MRRRITDAVLEHFFEADEGLPCPEGTDLLRVFAEKRPFDFAFLKQSNLVDLRNSAFDGIAEWDAFVEHYASCGRCNA